MRSRQGNKRYVLGLRSCRFNGANFTMTTDEIIDMWVRRAKERAENIPEYRYKYGCMFYD